MDIDTDEILRKRYWVRQNFEWLMSEVVFHRDMKNLFKNPRIKLWVLDEPEGRANPYEATERSE